MQHLVRFNPRLALGALAALACLGTLPAHAVGRLARNPACRAATGQPGVSPAGRRIPTIAGRPGARYAVSVRNTGGRRVLGVMSVDGVNVVSGETASWEQTGYVFAPWQAFQINGWRKSDAEVAAFHFTASQASYAARTGRPDNVGIIGVAVFREKPPMPPTAEPLALPRAAAESAAMGVRRFRNTACPTRPR